MRSRRGRSYLATGEFKGVETVDALNQQFDRQREGAAMRIIDVEMQNSKFFLLQTVH